MNNEIWKYVVLAAAAFVVYQLFMSKETLENVVEEPASQAEEPKKETEVPAQEEEAVSYFGKINGEEGVKLSAPVLALDAKQLEAEDLLPKYSEADEFAKENPVSKLLKEQNFLIAGYHTGVNTVMQSNKIPYHDLRSAPPIAKQEVGPWMQSSYEQPAGGPGSRRFFEVGQW